MLALHDHSDHSSPYVSVPFSASNPRPEHNRLVSGAEVGAFVSWVIRMTEGER